MSRSGGAPGSPGACIARPPAPSPGKLTLRGGFTVLDRQQCRLDQRARALGFVDLASYLRARCEQDAALPRMASELATTTPVVRGLLTQEGIQRPPQTVMTAKHRRRLTDQRLARQAAQLGFATLEDYLADRVAERAWPLGEVAGQAAGTTGHAGLCTLQAYLAQRRVEQDWPIRRIRAELHVDKAWLKHQMNQLEIP